MTKIRAWSVDEGEEMQMRMNGDSKSLWRSVLFYEVN
jgi:hypothetical protein